MPLVAAALFGAIVGSFLNVCILRLPLKESIVFPASHCMACRRAIAWYDNIPVLSFLVLRGRCRNCNVKISWQYPAIEFLTAALFVGFYLYFGPTVKGVIYLALTLALLVQSLIDARYQIIPDAITLPGIAIGFLLSLIFPSLHGESLWWKSGLVSLQGILLGGGFLLLLGTVAEWVLKKEAMGGGDVKLLAMIGAFLGWQAVLWTLFGASFLGAFVGIYTRLRKGEEKIPFGPYLAVAAVLYFFVGEKLIYSYFELWRM